MTSATPLALPGLGFPICERGHCLGGRLGVENQLFSGKDKISSPRQRRAVDPSRPAPYAALPLQGDRCIMGQQRSFRKRKPTSWCVKGKSFTSALEARVCRCRESDFLW